VPELAAASGWRTFAIYALRMIGQLVWVLTAMPEAKGISLEKIQKQRGIALEDILPDWAGSLPKASMDLQTGHRHSVKLEEQDFTASHGTAGRRIKKHHGFFIRLFHQQNNPAFRRLT
jgi:hypothetical protein